MKIENQEVVIFERVFAQAIDDEIVLLDSESENYFGLNELGAIIWGLLQKYRDLSVVYHLLQERYQVDDEVLKRDLVTFVDKLVESGLIDIKSKEN